MRKSKFSEAQIVNILKDAEAGVAVNDLLRTHGISRATFFKWRSKYGGAGVSDMTRLRELEAENAKLKRMYADLALENAAIAARAASGATAADRAAGTGPHVGARLHERDALRRPTRPAADGHRRRESGGLRDRDGPVGAKPARRPGAQRTRGRPRRPGGRTTGYLRSQGGRTSPC